MMQSAMLPSAHQGERCLRSVAESITINIGAGAAQTLRASGLQHAKAFVERFRYAAFASLSCLTGHSHAKDKGLMRQTGSEVEMLLAGSCACLEQLLTGLHTALRATHIIILKSVVQYRYSITCLVHLLWHGSSYMAVRGRVRGVAPAAHIFTR